MNNNYFKKCFAILLSVIMLILSFCIGAFAYEEYVNPCEHRYTSALGTVIAYDAPDTLLKASLVYANDSSDYEKGNLPLAEYDKISIKANGNSLFVYATGVATEHAWRDQINYYLPQRYTPVAYFDFSGEVNIDIDISQMSELCTDSKGILDAIENATVSPLNKSITPTINGNVISFAIKEQGDYTVTINNDEKTAIHIFARGIERFKIDENMMILTPKVVELPLDISSADTVIFSPGEYFFEDNQIWINNNQTVYISGGAVIHSNIQIQNVQNAKLLGRGIIDDSESESWKIENGKNRFVPVYTSNSSNIQISGISILNPCLWAVQLYNSSNIDISNIGIITGKHNGDGISVQSSQNISVTDCFVRSWDDSLVVKNYTDRNSSDILFRNITLWTDLAQSMEIGYETNNGKYENAQISNVAFEDITVIYNLHKPVISIHNADDALIKNITYKNITVENANMGKGDGADNSELIELSTKRTGNWASTEQRGNIKNILIENLTVLNTDKDKNVIRIEGANSKSTVENVTLKNIKIKNELLTSKKGNASLEIIKNKYVKTIEVEPTINIFTRLIAKIISFFKMIFNLFK